ncbi:glycosyltransferase [Photobacterium sp. TY1-4]|uniref:glycosyltransferase n=1 Tax=Photobacterium sp. TY1-4 TaxID=2899122 RepID=UPI0021BEAB94|nr:glycosyltransferase family 2 protein [Photobacterium sp. TY1-4]UXI00539.1 glycosyltransferase family 2 protein [Photobacterium sp. TY1-4]
MMATLFISIVSHNNDDLIIANHALCQIASEHQVVIKSNTPATAALKKHCINYNIVLIDKDHGLGFGENNNYVFKYCRNHLNMNLRDLFLVHNPDLVIEKSALNQYVETSQHYPTSISAINLYKDSAFTTSDDSIKTFPRLLTPILARIKNQRADTYNKREINTHTVIDWAAGSCLLIPVTLYEKLNGFDERYFMYFEDVDLARRCKKNGYSVVYLPEIKAIHYASYKNRKILSKNFLWYLRSFLRYHFI